MSHRYGNCKYTTKNLNGYKKGMYLTFPTPYGHGTPQQGKAAVCQKRRIFARSKTTSMESNPQTELAEKYVLETGVSIFLTGKAGTGKTTFLHNIAARCPKRSVIVAPTGVAAINAGGVTIHSFFQLPFCPYLPDVPELVTEYQHRQNSLRKSKLDIIRTLELLIIDEISMVRADLLDAVDATLRRCRRNSRPFGGVQLLMIGDVQQLAPVVTDEEKPFMDRVYPSPFFFHSKALRRINYVTIQLTTIYRQQDPDFVRLLNNIRDNRFDPETLRLLNTRVATGGTPENGGQEPILLTTHNHQADKVNQRRLAALPGRAVLLHADVEGNFPDSSAPTDKELALKVGAQVMFVKNDSSGEHRYYNGKIGTVTDIRKTADSDGRTATRIVVRDGDGNNITVAHERWENTKYVIDPQDNQIKQTVDGTFSQFPLKTAWAITIHKAQGLTFDRVQVDAAAAFAYGQVYVALSRCRSLQGLTLLSPITPRNAIDSRDIDGFVASFAPAEAVAAQLDGCRNAYLYDQILELFGFGTLQHLVEQLEITFQGHLRTTFPGHCATISDLAGTLAAQVSDVAERFHRQIRSIGQMPPEQARPLLSERSRKAAAYFLPILEQADARLDPLLDVDSDNKEAARRLKELAADYRDAMRQKKALLKMAADEDFDTARYQKAKADLALQKDSPARKNKKDARFAVSQHPDLMRRLVKWRTDTAKEKQLPAFTILQQKSLIAIADEMPHDANELKRIDGIGPQKVANYGSELLQIVEDYREEAAARATPRWQQAAALFAEGKSVEDIAGTMLRAVGTVEGYLVTAVEQNALDSDLIVTETAQGEIADYFDERRNKATLKDAYEHFGGRYSYFELRVARLALKDS